MKAVVFDLNGTLVDDIAYHFEAFKTLASKVGFAMDEVIFQSTNGQKNADLFPRLLGRELGPSLLETLSNEKETTYRTLYRPHMAPVKGATELFARLRDRGLKLAIASSAPDENRNMVLEGLGWSSTFDAVILPHDLPGKPAPDIYLAAAKRLGVDPTECIAFEDAVNGVKSAYGANMLVVGVTTNVPADTLLEAGAALTIADFTAPSLASLLASHGL